MGTREHRNLSCFSLCHKLKKLKSYWYNFKELEEKTSSFKSENKLVEAQKAWTENKYDLEMLQEVDFCSGVENYSAHLSGREKGVQDLILWLIIFLMIFDYCRWKYIYCSKLVQCMGR